MDSSPEVGWAPPRLVIKIVEEATRLPCDQGVTTPVVLADIVLNGLRAIPSAVSIVEEKLDIDVYHLVLSSFAVIKLVRDNAGVAPRRRGRTTADCLSPWRHILVRTTVFFSLPVCSSLLPVCSSLRPACSRLCPICRR